MHFFKKNKKFWVVSVIFLLLLVIAGAVLAADYYRLNSGSTLAIFDKEVTNNSGNDYFIPTKTTTEWNSFLNNLPSNVTQKDIPPASWAYKGK